ncbi:CHY zinc finger protein [Pueribacillus sp. YX66]|uniref:CHY zinc finger protein n=1 Tax=Pueribacillus sp. YX66 TaxID=3229242 RepID=UPI00358D9659
MKTLKVYGQVIDNESRCIHYHSTRDIISLKFRCCDKYYPCYKCHDEFEDHPIAVWGRAEFDEHAILCGACKCELTIHEYMNAERCPYCTAEFNPGCATHYHFYFDVKAQD